MSTPSTTTVTTKPSTSEKRGSNRQPKEQVYKARPSKTIKVWTETIKRARGADRLAPSMRSALAFFTIEGSRSSE